MKSKGNLMTERRTWPRTAEVRGIGFGTACHPLLWEARGQKRPDIRRD